MTIISVIVGRQGRFSEKPAQWIFQHLQWSTRLLPPFHP